MKLPQINLPAILKPQKRYKPYYYIAGLCVIYTPYFIYFPHPQPWWPRYLYVYAYIPLCLLIGFFISGIYFLFYKRRKDRIMKDEREREEDRKRIMAVTGGVPYTMEDSEKFMMAGLAKPEKAFLPRKMNLVEKWKGRRGRGRMRSETIWDADEWRDSISLTDASDVIRKREEEGFHDIPLEYIQGGQRTPGHMV
ncbi:hypothetical protein K491DRAFT_21327 [Lophiostoma macrostomum CBS 122681]|uniref:Uncharacterized protein n=1 Tax=Lophiostoma macrostomum CBS 122681 TaxID=1314788 RepID=A0A6A6SZH3_9PLEO|nr:hypothetical protein K491DRAFT_21327 [Lophiostoma macrostomum CBS 122681]